MPPIECDSALTLSESIATAQADSALWRKAFCILLRGIGKHLLDVCLFVRRRDLDFVRQRCRHRSLSSWRHSPTCALRRRSTFVPWILRWWRWARGFLRLVRRGLAFGHAALLIARIGVVASALGRRL